MPRQRGAVLAVTLLFLAACSDPDPANPVQRGAYLATVGGCHDCHTPKVFSDDGTRLDESRLLSGHPAADVLPGFGLPAATPGPTQWGAVTNAHLTAWAGSWGVSYSANLTPDQTGIGDWTVEQFIQAMRTGKHAHMPWNNSVQMSKADLRALFAYLRSLPPVANAVPPAVPPAMATAPPMAGS